MLAKQVFYIANGDISLKIATIYDIIPTKEGIVYARIFL